jgi:hypothetical protein
MGNDDGFSAAWKRRHKPCEKCRGGKASGELREDERNDICWSNAGERVRKRAWEIYVVVLSSTL